MAGCSRRDRSGEETTASWAVYQCADRDGRPDRGETRQTKFLRLSATLPPREAGFANTLVTSTGGSCSMIDGRGQCGLTEARQEGSSRSATVRSSDASVALDYQCGFARDDHRTDNVS